MTLQGFLKADSFSSCRPGAIESFYMANHMEKVHGWRGILVEAHRELHAKLAQGRPLNHCVNACLGSGQASWFEEKTTGLLGHSQLRDGKLNDECRPVQTRPISDLLKAFNAPPIIDFMVIDVERAFLEVWRGLPLDSWQVDFLAIEIKGAAPREILDGMAAHGLQLVKILNGEDYLFARP